MAEGRPRPINERFDAAVEVIKSLPQEGPFQPSNNVKLRFYALYKQVKEGPCNKPKPSFWDAVGRAKWEAWNICGKMSKELAMQMYVEELQQVVETMPQTPEVEQFLRSIGPFYEEVPDGDADTEITGELHSETAMASSESKETSLASEGQEDSPGGGGRDTQDLGDRGEGGDGGGEVAGKKTESGEGGEDGGEDAKLLASPPVERSGSIEDQSESDDENSDVFQESHQEFTLPSSSSMVVSSNTEHHPLPVGAKGWSEEEAASHKAFVTPRDSQTSPPMLVSDYSRPNISTSQAASLQELTTQVDAIQSKLQDILQQLSQVSLAASSRRLSSNSQQCPQCSSRRKWLFFIGPVMLSWPLLVKYLMAYLTRRFGNSWLAHEWVWSLVTFLHTAYSVAMLVFLSHQIRS